MSEKVAIVYWCDGAGHAARAIPVAKEIESRGEKVSIAGGGPGGRFVDLNGFEQPELTTVTVKGDSVPGFLAHGLSNVVPNCIRRFGDIWSWLNEEDPDTVVTDDLLGLVAAILQRREIYRIDHVQPEMFDLEWRLPSEIYNRLSLIFAEEIVVTSLWSQEEDAEGYTKVNPLAQEGESDPEVDPYDVLLSPGTHGENFDQIRQRLEDRGLSVRMVGDDDWDTKPSMTPYTEKAEVTVCTGFSSIADSVVAGTPCIVYPFLPFQEALAEEAQEKDLKGIETASDVQEVVEHVEYFIENQEDPEYENGAKEFVDAVTGEEDGS